VTDRRLSRDRAALVVVDVQEAFRKAVPAFDRVAERAGILVQAARETGIPLVVTEQYPKGLGETAPEVRDQLPDAAVPIEKLAFSAAEAEGFDLDGRDQAIVCGVETHVCVSHTVLDLLEQGVEVHVAEDAVGSRSEDDKRVALRRMEHAGAVLTTVEMALFELVRRAGTDEFKRLQALVR
jgi:nicotinamidase-related amidase